MTISCIVDCSVREKPLNHSVYTYNLRIFAGDQSLITNPAHTPTRQIQFYF